MSDLNRLVIGLGLSKQWHSAPDAFRAGIIKTETLTGTRNHTRKASGTQGTLIAIHWQKRNFQFHNHISIP